MTTFMNDFTATFRVEMKKVSRSRTLWITALAVLLAAAIGGVFMFILKDPEQARRLGLVGAQAQIFGGTADWPSFFNLMLVLMSVGGLIIFGFIFTWIFGREFSDKTVYDMLSLPTSRYSIIIAKVVVAALWSVALMMMVFVLMLIIGGMLRLPDWSAAVVWHGFRFLLATGCLTVLLCIPFSLVSSFTRGYLPAVGCIFLVMILSQVITQLGNGQYFPWTVPMLFSGAAESLTGRVAEPLGTISYILVGLTGVISFIITLSWWRYADQS
jgi:ABC-2 type transport system permease protein